MFFFLNEPSAIISLTFNNSRPIKCVLDHAQPPDRLRSQGAFSAGCQDEAESAAWKPAPNTIHSCTGTKQEGRFDHRKALWAQEKYIRKSILITANKAGNTSQNLVVITPIIPSWVFTSPALPGEGATCSHSQLLYHHSGGSRALESICSAMPRDPDMMDFPDGTRRRT